ncbi:MAG: 4'-phosphopantetheinyl transferase superfamily protein [Thermocrispum sp.]
MNGPAIAGIGVDIEDDRAPEPETAGLFLTCTERSQLTAVAPEQGPPTLQRLWTVKEALFKADPDNSTGVLRRYSVTSATARHGPAVRHRTASPAAPAFHYLSLALPRGFISVAVALLPHWRMQTMHAVDFGRMAERISSLASVPVTRLTPGTVITDLIPDSFTFIEITVDLQEEYDVVLDGNDLEGLRTLGDLAELLQDRQRGH